MKAVLVPRRWNVLTVGGQAPHFLLLHRGQAQDS